MCISCAMPRGEDRRGGCSRRRRLRESEPSRALAAKGLLPGDHLIDAGFVDVELLVGS